MSSKNEKKEDETKDGDNKKDEQKPEEGNEEEEEEDELILEEFGGIEDILEKFSLSMKEVSGVIIVNSDGITVKSTIDKQLTMQVRNYFLLILRKFSVRKKLRKNYLIKPHYWHIRLDMRPIGLYIS